MHKPHHYFAMTKRSTYVDRHEHPGQEGRGSRLVIVPGGRRFLFVYPFVKTRAWYQLPREERQREMDPHIAPGHRYPGVKINTPHTFAPPPQNISSPFRATPAPTSST